MSLSNHLISQRFALTINPCSTNIMREEPNFRQRDIQCAFREGRIEERTERTARNNYIKKYGTRRKLTTEQLESFFERMAKLDEKK
jgi:hypothetical protein